MKRDGLSWVEGGGPKEKERQDRPAAEGKRGVAPVSLPSDERFSRALRRAVAVKAGGAGSWCWSERAARGGTQAAACLGERRRAHSGPAARNMTTTCASSTRCVGGGLAGVPTLPWRLPCRAAPGCNVGAPMQGCNTTRGRRGGAIARSTTRLARVRRVASGRAGPEPQRRPGRVRPCHGGCLVVRRDRLQCTGSASSRRTATRRVGRDG